MGTRLPDGLSIVRDELNEAYGAMHYAIAPAFDMPLLRFKALLNHLAQQIIREAVQCRFRTHGHRLFYRPFATPFGIRRDFCEARRFETSRTTRSTTFTSRSCWST